MAYDTRFELSCRSAKTGEGVRLGDVGHGLFGMKDTQWVEVRTVVAGQPQPQTSGGGGRVQAISLTARSIPNPSKGSMLDHRDKHKPAPDTSETLLFLALRCAFGHVQRDGKEDGT